LAIPGIVARAFLLDLSLSPVDWYVFSAIWETCPDTLDKLGKVTGLARQTAAIACRRLNARGWCELRGKGRAVHPVPVIGHDCQAEMVRNLVSAYDVVANRGEFLMRSYLDLRVCDDRYIDHARPAFLTNPLTQEPLEYDRYYHCGVAFEFNGPQHYRETSRFADTDALRAVQARDLIKKGLSHDSRITLVTVTGEQLRLDVMEMLLPESLPRRPLDTAGSYYQCLAGLCTEYALRVGGRAGKRSDHR
jgi:hypothetical protein